MTSNFQEFVAYFFLFSIFIPFSYSCPSGYSGSPCKDVEPPLLNCPGPTLETSTDKGKPTAKVIWSIQVTDNSIQVDPNALIRVQSSNQSGEEFPIGDNAVKVTATDEAGNVGTCSFLILVRDFEPPSCSFCPGDIVREGLERQVRVNWEHPHCSDNSGSWPAIAINRHTGSIFNVPGLYHIHYAVSDFANNVNRNCSFTIILKVKTCPMLTPPLNGALVCNSFDYNSVCAVFCETGTDFVSTPAWFYFCFSAEWSPWPFGSLLIDSCSGSANSLPKMQPSYYYSGNAHESSVQETIKSQFHGLLTSGYLSSILCPNLCNKDAITVTPGITG